MKSGTGRAALAAVGLLLGLALAAASIPATAAPHHNNGLTIAATPDPNVDGDPVLIYGQLNLPHPGNRTIRLFHRVNPASRFTFLRKAKTDARGFYEFPRTEGIVTSNRSWFVRGPEGTHSRTVHERVAALLTLEASTSSAATGAPVTFSGSLSPALGHLGESLTLQVQRGEAGDAWVTIDTGAIGPRSSYSISHRFMAPGAYDLRVSFGGDMRNIPASSDEVTVIVQQAQHPFFTINTSAPTVDEGSPVEISGVLYKPGSSTVPQAGATVTLWGQSSGAPSAAIASTTTAPDGGYSFTQAPVHDTTFQVHTAGATPTERVTAPLQEGIRDVVSVAAGATAASVGQTVVFVGTVTPDKAGHTIALQSLGPDGHFHTIRTTSVSGGSTYALVWTAGSTGTHTLRVHIAGGPLNAGANSASVSVAVTLPPLSSLPPAS